jgi:hypothetical protein
MKISPKMTAKQKEIASDLNKEAKATDYRNAMNHYKDLVDEENKLHKIRLKWLLLRFHPNP